MDRTLSFVYDPCIISCGGDLKRKTNCPFVSNIASEHLYASSAAIEAQSNLNRTGVIRITKFSQDFSNFCLIAVRALVAFFN